MLLEPCSLILAFIMKIALVAPSDAYLFDFCGALTGLHSAAHEVFMAAPPGPFGVKFEAPVTDL